MSQPLREFCQVCGVEKTELSSGHNDDHTGVRHWWCSMWCFEPPTDEVKQARLLLIRGLPGSGKSTMAKSMMRRGYFDAHLEADMFHMNHGAYLYRETSAIAAHAWCLNTARIYLHNRMRVVVANTFVTLESLRPYMELGFQFHIVEARGSFGSTHNVPDAVIARMKRTWQELP